MPEKRNLSEALTAVSPPVLVGFAVAVLTLVVVSSATLFALSRRTADVASVRHTFSVLRSIEELIDEVDDSQLALTEYVITADPAFVESYERARRTLPATLSRIRDLTAGRPDAMRRLTEVEAILETALERDGREIEARRSGLSIGELRPMLLESKGLLDKSTSMLNTLKDDTVHLLEVEQQRLSDSIRSSILIVVLGDVVLLALIVTAAGLALRDAADKARAALFQRRVLGMVGHDLRQPLSVVTMISGQLARIAPGERLPPTVVARISTAAQRMETMIRDLLDYSRVELESALPLEIRSASVHESCARIVEELRAVHPDREIRYEPGDRPEVRWDPDRIEQVLANLVGNALKYGKRDAPVRVGWKRQDEAIVIEVNNRGAPIPPSFLPHIFEPFRRGVTHDGPTAKNSLGLGLYIVRHIVAQHGGAIDVRSSEVEGTTFEVKLPAQSPVRERAPLE